MVSSIVNNAGSSAGTSGPNRFGDLSSEQFLKIIFTELQRQDPLQPNDSSKLLEQLSSIRSIQSDLELSSRLEALVGQNQLATAGSLIGKRIIGLDENFLRISGTVVGVNKTRDGAVLRLDNGFRVPFANVEQMLGEAPPSNSAPSTPTTPTDGGTGGTGTPQTPTPSEPTDPKDPGDPKDEPDPGE
ncbi:MAG: hypothetical protein KF768_05985 [Phycisphaeraceae bacterium]|nr:hypothetical protein [Phycisphaeraceae bacterium]